MARAGQTCITQGELAMPKTMVELRAEGISKALIGLRQGKSLRALELETGVPRTVIYRAGVQAGIERPSQVIGIDGKPYSATGLYDQRLVDAVSMKEARRMLRLKQSTLNDLIEQGYLPRPAVDRELGETLSRKVIRGFRKRNYRVRYSKT